MIFDRISSIILSRGFDHDLSGRLRPQTRLCSISILLVDVSPKKSQNRSYIVRELVPERHSSLTLSLSLSLSLSHTHTHTHTHTHSHTLTHTHKR
jgi:hypothetical protein